MSAARFTVQIYWHPFGKAMRKMFKCDECNRRAAWGKRLHPRGRSERVLCTVHARAEGLQR